MSDWLNRTIRDGHRAKGDLHEYVYEIPVRADPEETDPAGTVLLRLTSEPVPFFGQAPDEGGPKRPEVVWKYVLRTRLKSDRGVVVAEPFEGGLPFVVSGVGPWDPEPDGGFQPDVLAARLLAFVSDWRGPEGPLTDDQREWFSWLGTEVNAMLPREETAAAEWMNGRRVSGS
ncbi:hypothetical protein ACFVZH_16635 [Streptomyces sp. NPDC059534]|uniref:hypothetical protein n=1 Tax=Streptomyces sp. NPDC059534 TaxID=3346859 RepID=UPI0036CC52EE